MDIYLVSDILTQYHKQFILEHNITYTVIDKPYDDYDQMVQDYQNGTFYISSLYCENSIYRNESDNILFRVVHDYLHITNRLNFTIAQEFRLGYMQVGQLAQWLQNQDISDIEAEIVLFLYHKDILGQLEYLEQNGHFPENQLEFALGGILQKSLDRIA